MRYSTATQKTLLILFRTTRDINVRENPWEKDILYIS